MLGEVAQHEIVRDRRHPVEPGLAELALDVVLGGETMSAQVSIAAFAAAQLASDASSLAMFASAPHERPASKRAAALRAIRSAASTCAQAEARGN